LLITDDECILKEDTSRLPLPENSMVTLEVLKEICPNTKFTDYKYTNPNVPSGLLITCTICNISFANRRGVEGHRIRRQYVNHLIQEQHLEARNSYKLKDFGYKLVLPKILQWNLVPGSSPQAKLAFVKHFNYLLAAVYVAMVQCYSFNAAPLFCISNAIASNWNLDLYVNMKQSHCITDQQAQYISETSQAQIRASVYQHQLQCAQSRILQREYIFIIIDSSTDRLNVSNKFVRLRLVMKNGDLEHIALPFVRPLSSGSVGLLQAIVASLHLIGIDIMNEEVKHKVSLF
jgi:hypothetical protein